MFDRKVLGSLILLAAVAFAGPAQAAALIYESFSQAAGSLTGKAGGDGLSGNWSVNQTVTVVNPPTLSYGNLPNAGGQVNLTNGNGVDAWITTTSVLADNNLLDNGATLWFSTMFQKTSGGGSNEQAGFAFGTERVDGAYNGVRMDTGYGVGFFTRNNALNVATWSNGSNSNGGSLSVPYSTPTFVVGKIQWGAADSDAETITLYTPSLTDLGTLGTGVSKTVAGFDQTLLDTISFTQRNSGGTQTYDEIRFGASYDDVIGVVAAQDGSLQIVKFFDENGNGIQDGNELLLPPDSFWFQIFDQAGQAVGEPIPNSHEIPLLAGLYTAQEILQGDWHVTSGNIQFEIVAGQATDVLVGNAVPEPATMALLSLAACGLGGYVRRRRKA